MFLKYGGCNFFCFKEHFEIDLRLNKNCPESISKGKDHTKTLCIKGANAAGKTNALKALSFLCDFMSNSFNSKPDSEIDIESYFMNDQLIELFCEFRIANIEYRYEITLNRKKVLTEILFKIAKQPKILFKREANSLIETMDTLNDLLDIPQIRSNASIISIANQHEIKGLQLFYNMFNVAISNVGHEGFRDHSPEGVDKFYNDFPEALAFVSKQINRFDTGVSNIEIDSYTNKEGNEVYYPVFIFNVNGENKSLRLHNQSAGTKRLYYLLGFIFVALQKIQEIPFSTIFIADELDLHLHSNILPELTELFEKSTNSQLIFSCQNDQIIDLMGKYRTTIINKDDNESYSYRLDELPSDLLRNNRPITPHYRTNSIGGVPQIG